MTDNSKNTGEAIEAHYRFVVWLVAANLGIEKLRFLLRLAAERLYTRAQQERTAVAVQRRRRAPQAALRDAHPGERSRQKVGCATRPSTLNIRTLGPTKESLAKRRTRPPTFALRQGARATPVL